MLGRPEASIFVDGAYLHKINQIFGYNLDYEKFFDELCEPDFYRKRTYYFDALPWKPFKKPTQEQVDFFNNKQRFLEMINFIPRTEVRYGKTQMKSLDPPIFVQKMVDVLLSLCMVNLAWKKDIRYFILIAGDSDFVPAVKAVKEHGGTIKVVYALKKKSHFKVQIHHQLKIEVDERFEITDAFWNQVIRK